MLDVLLLSRVQFGITAAFHILFPIMSIGIASYLFIMEAMWLFTKKEKYYHQLRFWIKVFILTFALGVASGFPLAFQFGTNWSRFAEAAGPFFGNIIGFETTIAFTLEATFLGILLFGWKRVSRRVHLLSNFLVLFGASLSAFWIIAANSWMQVPDGVHMEAGKIVVDRYFDALFNRATVITYAHMWLACIESSLFLIGGLAAFGYLYHKEKQSMREFFARSLKYVIILAAVVAPLQVVIGDLSGVNVAKVQPEKLAAMELHWNTNPNDTGAPLHLIAIPNQEGNGNSYELNIPNALSILITRDAHGTIPGINSFQEDVRPSVLDSVLMFYSLRVMIIIGFILVGLVLLGLLYWRKGFLNESALLSHRFFLGMWLFAIPLGFIASEAGWMVREIGR